MSDAEDIHCMNLEYDNPDRGRASRRWTRMRPMDRAEWGEPDHRGKKKKVCITYSYYIVIRCKSTVDRHTEPYSLDQFVFLGNFTSIPHKKSAQAADQKPKIAHKIWTAMTDSVYERFILIQHRNVNFISSLTCGFKYYPHHN